MIAGCGGDDGAPGKSGESCVAKQEEGFVTITCGNDSSGEVHDGANGEDGAKGEDGADGEDGAPGEDGTDGENGTDGDDGRTGLILATAEPDGANCVNGGQKLQVGLDDDGDGMLDPGEVDSTVYVCNGEDGAGAFQSLLRVTAETAGSNCTNGGQKIEFGLDNGDNAGTRNNGNLEIV
jgi:hypothetical protein